MKRAQVDKEKPIIRELGRVAKKVERQCIGRLVSQAFADAVNGANRVLDCALLEVDSDPPKPKSKRKAAKKA